MSHFNCFSSVDAPFPVKYSLTLHWALSQMIHHNHSDLKTFLSFMTYVSARIWFHKNIIFPLLFCLTSEMIKRLLCSQSKLCEIEVCDVFFSLVINLLLTKLNGRIYWPSFFFLYEPRCARSVLSKLWSTARFALAYKTYFQPCLLW